MSKQKKTKIADQKALKHYTGLSNIPDEINQPHIKKILKEVLASNPEIIKPEIAIDHTLAKRKSAVVHSPPPPPVSKKKKR